MNVPQIEYSLGGIGTFGDLPGISNIIKEILETQVKARLVWPNRILMTLPIAKVRKFKKNRNPALELIRPEYVLHCGV